MDTAGHPIPPAAWLDQLHAARQWERLEKLALERLGADPSEATGHFHRAWALLRLERPAEMEPHVTHLMKLDPEDARHLQLAVLWHMSARRYSIAMTHMEAALRIAPECAQLHYLAAILAARQRRLQPARRYAARARQLDPENADIAHFEIELRGLDGRTAADAFQTLRQFEEAIRLDPENAGIMVSMADIHLYRLADPRRAEELYRSALTRQPGCKEYQKKLWDAIQSTNLFFRTLRLPLSAVKTTAAVLIELRMKPWIILLLVFGFKAVIVWLVWLIISAALFGPPAWLFEWLVLMDVQRATQMSPRVGGWWLHINRLPFALRLGFCLALVLCFWWGLFRLAGFNPRVGFSIIGIFFLLNFTLVFFHAAIRKFAAWRAIAAAKPFPTSSASAPPTPE